MHRLDDLADREESFRPSDGITFKNLVPLDEIIAEAMGVGKDTMGVEREYNLLIQRMGNEFDILLEVPAEELTANCNPRIAKGIVRVRNGQVEKVAGYDGEYGKIKIFGEKDNEKEEKQLSFF
jgi:PHP family Zn ribbon phosphoesterase